MKSRCGGVADVAERKGDYAVNVKKIMPGMVCDVALNLEYIRIPGRYELHFLQSLLDSIVIVGIIGFTTGGAAHATT